MGVINASHQCHVQRPFVLGVQRAHSAVGSYARVACTTEDVTRAVGGEHDKRKVSSSSKKHFKKEVP